VAAIIVAATGLELLRAGQAESRFPNGGRKRLRRVENTMFATLSDPVSARGGLELAEQLGTIGTPRIYVHGVQGGVIARPPGSARQGCAWRASTEPTGLNRAFSCAGMGAGRYRGSCRGKASSHQAGSP